MEHPTVQSPTLQVPGAGGVRLRQAAGQPEGRELAPAHHVHSLPGPQAPGPQGQLECFHGMMTSL